MDSSSQAGKEHTNGSNFAVTRLKGYWAVYESGQLVCMTVYRKGAVSVVDRLTRGMTKPSEACVDQDDEGTRAVDL